MSQMINTLFHFETDPSTVVLVRKCPILTVGIYVYIPVLPENKFPTHEQSPTSEIVASEFPTDLIFKSEEGILCTILSSAVDLTDVYGRVFQSILLKKYVEKDLSNDSKINSKAAKYNKSN